MLLVDVVKFTVGGWSGRSTSCASFSILRRPAAKQDTKPTILQNPFKVVSKVMSPGYLHLVFDFL